MSGVDSYKDGTGNPATVKNRPVSSQDMLNSQNLLGRSRTNQSNTGKSDGNAIEKGKMSPEITQYLKALETDENDKDAWINLAKSLQTTSLEEAISVFQLILKTFPTSCLFLEMFCDIEEKARNFPALENLLQQNLKKCSSIRTYGYYCKYYEKKTLSQKVDPIDVTMARDEVEKLYSSILSNIGDVYESDEIWRLYKSFLEKQPKNDVDSGYEEKIRSFFQKVIVLPIRNVELFWKDFTEFETSLVVKMDLTEEEKKDKIRERISPFAEQHALAIKIAKNRESFWSPIQLDRLALPQMGKEDVEQLNLMKRALGYEVTNPMGYDQVRFCRLMSVLYNRAVAIFLYAPDLWLEYARFKSQYYPEETRWKEAVQVLKKGLEGLGTSTFYRLACCDFYEENGHLEEAEHEYEQLSSLESSVTWIQYMYFARRTKGIEAGREIFRRARLSLLSPDIFIAAAHLESDVNNQQQSARSVLESGLVHFSKRIEYILDYVDCLLEWNDPSNACLLLENSINLIGRDSSSALWEKLMAVKQSYFMSPTSLKLLSQTEKEYYASNKDNKSLSGLLGSIHRYIDYNMKPLSLEDRVLLKRMDKNHLRREEGTRKLLVTNKKAIIPMGDGVITNTEAPEWLQLYLQKIPSFDKEKARGNTVDEVTDILARATIPSLRTFVKP